MNAKETILQSLRAQARPTSSYTRPELPPAHFSGDPFDTFSQTLTAAGGHAIRVHNTIDAQAAIVERYPELGDQGVYSLCPELLTSNRDWSPDTPAPDLESPYLSVLRGTLGVMENGAVWVDKATLGIPGMAFWCEHLVLLIEASTLCPRMSEAYQNLHAQGQHNGYFIAGPSKTADIVQTLVMGAQGARSCLVLVQG